MSIIEKAKVIQAYARALSLDPDPEAACATVAQALALPVESVQQAVAEDSAVTS